MRACVQQLKAKNWLIQQDSLNVYIVVQTLLLQYGYILKNYTVKCDGGGDIKPEEGTFSFSHDRRCYGF